MSQMVKMTVHAKNPGRSQKARRRAPLRAALRVVIAALLQVVMLYFVSGVEGNDYYFQTVLNGFLFALLPTASALLLVLVLIRGTLGEKINAAVLLLPAVWFGFMGWAPVICGLFG